MQVKLEKILEYIAENVYDHGHGLLSPIPNWVLDAVPFLDYIAEEANISKGDPDKLFKNIQELVEKDVQNIASLPNDK